MEKLWRDYNLSIVLLILFLVCWIIQTWVGWQKYAAEQEAHGQAAEVFGDDGYVWDWGQATFENWQSEFLQLFTMVTLTSFLIHKGSAESRDGQDKMEAMIKNIQEELKELKKLSNS